MPYNELRKDYLLNRWVVIATERSRRPTDFARPKTDFNENVICPLCVGHEHMTPPAIMLYVKENGEIKTTRDPLAGERTKNWLVRTIPNLYPAFTPPTHPADVKKIWQNDSFGYAIGHHEVLVESPNHKEHPSVAELSQLELIVNACIDRLRELSAKPYVKYVSIFRNYEKEAGASLSHAHSQLIATPTIPISINEELIAARNFYLQHNKCIFCDIIDKEKYGPRLVYENAGFIVFTPYASINPLEFWILPKKHSPTLLNMARTEISEFARALKTSLKALKDLVNDPAYNFGFHLAINKEEQNYYHWHLEVYPKISIWAGFEKSTGMYINTIRPETAALELRNVLKP
jgi:UDPglucose--hexose-1-phosphate uridylyltransferase